MKKSSAKDEMILFARKIKALAEQGVDGEAESATAALKRYLEKNGLTMDDIAEVPMQEYGIVTTKESHLFIHQVIASVIGQPKVRGRWKKGRTLSFKSTYAEYVEIKDRVAHFWNAYKKEQEIFYEAFIQKNHLYANPDLKDRNEKPEPLTPEEKERLRRMMAMMDGIETDDYHKKLTNK